VAIYGAVVYAWTAAWVISGVGRSASQNDTGSWWSQNFGRSMYGAVVNAGTAAGAIAGVGHEVNRLPSSRTIAINMVTSGVQAINNLLGGWGSKYAGGPVPGANSQPVPIMAHGGEYVLSSDVVDRIKRGAPSRGADMGNAVEFAASGGGGSSGGVSFAVGSIMVDARGATDPQAVADATVRGLRDWVRQNGPLPVAVTGRL
jgi:hypothetical protein